MSFPAASRADHQKFCEREGWSRVRNGKDQTGTHHVTYELHCPSGEVLCTRISHPPDGSTYGKGLWSHILRDQLKVTEGEFWSCIRGEGTPDRGQGSEPGSGVPASLIYQLVAKFHVPEDEVAAMTKEQALERLQQLWSDRE